MTAKRMWWMIRLAMIRSNKGKAEYARKHGIYNAIGENVGIQSKFLPIYSELIRFHNNITIARGVDFCTHDMIHRILNRVQKETKFRENIGCIEIMDNVFVGSNSVLLYGTKIGPNVIIASGSVVVKDCEPNSVYAGCPARKIGTFDDYVAKRRLQEQNGELTTTTHNQRLTPEEIENAWRVFDAKHS